MTLSPDSGGSSQQNTDESDIERAARQAADRLEQRGVRVYDDDTAEERAVLLSALEQFERAVAGRGGDSFLNSPRSSRPERREFVIPPRGDDEDAVTYASRVREAADALGPPAH